MSQPIRKESFVFFHAHPDDEAIFTGGTIALLSGNGHRCVVVFATSGELGAVPESDAVGDLGDIRRSEAIEACRLLGVERVEFLDHSDSGISVDPAQRPEGSFVDVSINDVAERLALIASESNATALVTYDASGVYGHPDHVHAYLVGVEAARIAGLGTWYEVTVDREYLHFVDTHVVSLAGSAIFGGPAIGMTTVEISKTVDVRSVLDAKRASIAAHSSQVPDPTFGTGDAFADVYGYEWYVCHGTPTALDEL